MKETLLSLIQTADQTLQGSTDFRMVAQARATRQSLIPLFWELGEREQAQDWLEAVGDPVTRAGLQMQMAFKEGKPEQEKIEAILAPFVEKDYLKISRWYLQAGWEFGNVGETELAVSFCRRAVELNPGDMILIFQAATLMVSLGDVSSAREVLLQWAPFTFSITSMYVLGQFAEEMAKQKAVQDLWMVAGMLRRGADQEMLFNSACKAWLAQGEVERALQWARVPEAPSTPLYEAIAEHLVEQRAFDELRKLAALPTGHWPNGPARLIFFKHYCRGGQDQDYIQQRLLSSLEGAKKLPAQALADNLPHLLEAALWQQMTGLVAEILPLFPRQNAHQSFLRVLRTHSPEGDPQFRIYLVQALRGMAQALNPLQRDTLLLGLEEELIRNDEKQRKEYEKKVLAVDRDHSAAQRYVDFLLKQNRADLARDCMLNCQEKPWYGTLFTRCMGLFFNREAYPEMLELLQSSPSAGETLKWGTKLLAKVGK